MSEGYLLAMNNGGIYSEGHYTRYLMDFIHIKHKEEVREKDDVVSNRSLTVAKTSTCSGGTSTPDSCLLVCWWLRSWPEHNVLVRGYSTDCCTNY